MKQLFLNDLSIFPLAADFTGAWQRIHKFITTYKSRPDDLFENRICYEQYLGNIQLAADLDLQSFCSDPRGRTLGSLLLGLGKHPYIVPDSNQENSFIESNYYILKDGKKVPAYGLAAAFLHESIGISFLSEAFWDNVVFALIIEDKNKSKNSLPVLSVACPTHYQSKEFLQWQDDHAEIVLIESELSHENKRIHLRNDHGRNILYGFAKKLTQSPYIVEIVNSLPFNCRDKDFIRTIKKNGLIELVLTSTDEGLGLVVKTTGRNLRETERIASILKDEYEK